MLIRDKDKEAAKYFQISADQGNRIACYNLGVLYETGKGVEKNYSQAAAWLLKSADQDYSPAQQNLGVLYALGKGVPQDYDQAIEYLQRGIGKNRLICEAYLAQVLSSFPQDEYGLRDGHLAIKIAERLVGIRRSSEHLHTLAAAYAEVERFAEAIEIQQEVLSNLTRKRTLSRQLLKDCEVAINRYKFMRPFRDRTLAFHRQFDLS